MIAEDLIDEEMEDEMRRYELRMEAEEAREQWRQLYNRLTDEGWIRVIDPADWPELPPCVKSKRGLEIDTMATMFGYDYTQDFVDLVVSSYERFCAYKGVK